MGRFSPFHWCVKCLRSVRTTNAKQMRTQKLVLKAESPYFCADKSAKADPIGKTVHLKSNQFKNLELMKKLMFVMAMTLIGALQVNAQNAKIDDKEIVGVWLMESMQWEGEKKKMCGKETGYTQFKYYGADGEYACAELALTKEGKVVVMPHEYGTYTFKDGWYSEMGREKIKDAIVWVDKTTTKGTWKNRHDIWKKVTLPDKVVKYIMDCCKTKNTPADIQQMIKQHMFK